MFNLDAEQSLSESNLSLKAVDQSHRWLLVLVAVHPDVKQMIQEVLVVR